MGMITFPIEHKKLWGYTTASVLSLLLDREEEPGQWIPILASDMQEALAIHPSGVVTARERLRADRVIDVKRVGNTHQYRINHARLREINDTE